MSKKLLFVAAFVATLSVIAAQAQDTTNNQTASASQADGSVAPSADASGYGGAVGKSESGSMSNQLALSSPLASARCRSAKSIRAVSNPVAL